jgi:carboxylesterase
MKIKKKTIKNLIILAILILITAYIISVLLGTGFLQASKIDNRDKNYWEYDSSGVIKNADEFTILGDGHICWYLIHSYTATPNEMRDLARTLNAQLDDFIFVQRLSGHSEVPSALEGKNLDVWYEETLRKFKLIEDQICIQTNVVGSSLGSILALRLAQDEEIKNLYILNPFISKPYEFYKIFPFETRTKLLANILNYKKKQEVGKINSPEGQEAHIAYWNMPYGPVKDSLKFIDETIANLDKIQNPTFIAYSENDEVTKSHSALTIYNKINTTNKLLLNYKNSNHVLLLDYDKLHLMEDLLKFELINRE